MKSSVQVVSAPVKPLVIYDGDCSFCRFWIERLRRMTGEQVDYLPFQDPALAARFRELPREALERAVHLVEPDGAVFWGAEAAFRALAHNAHEGWFLDWYNHSTTFARVAESAYSFIARHRSFFSALTRLCWGRQVEPPTHQLVRWIFLRSLAVIYLIAFLSLWVQITGLIGSNGIVPARLTMENVRHQVDAAHIGLNRYHVFPTLCWFSSSDRFLKVQCAAGVGMAVVLLAGAAPAVCLVLLWVLYLSLMTIGGEFLGFQWDSLLLECGFLAIFLAPLQLRAALWRAPPPSRLVLWLFRWLLFRLMFESGCVKLLSGDPAWRKFTALRVHYETQPLPTWVGWYAHQLPANLQKASTIAMFGIELAVPFLIFAPRRLRQFACPTLLLLQVVILLTGNYCFFNLLTIALCLLLLDDAAVSRFFPSRWRERVSPKAEAVSRRGRWPRLVTVPLAVIIMVISLIQIGVMFRVRVPGPAPVIGLYQWLAPFCSVNKYGLFAVMTPTRPEIIVQGSNDGVHWQDYEFKYKPGEVTRRPGFVEPHQPRLDWQMWFAALGQYQQNPWFVNFCVRLLQGSPEVVGSLRGNPFPNEPPRFVRAVVYEYHFTDFATRRRTGAWWRREFKGLYLPPISMRRGKPESGAAQP